MTDRQTYESNPVMVPLPRFEVRNPNYDIWMTLATFWSLDFDDLTHKMKENIL